MPGIFGFALRQTNPAASDIAKQLSSDLCLYDWQESKSFEANSNRVFMGVAWNSLEPAARGASYYSSEDVSCVLCGYLTRTRVDCGASSALSNCEYAEAAAIAYRRFGDDFIEHLEGPFCLVLFDHSSNRLLGATERHGLSPLYRYDGPEGVVFCSMLGPMARSGLFPSTIDTASAATHLIRQQQYYRQSLIKNVFLQDPATIAVFTAEKSECSVKKFWHYGSTIPRGKTNYAQCIDELCDTMISATDRILKLPGRLFTSLSGGLDSRLMTGLALKRGSELEAWTFGTPDALDMVIAKRICKNYNMPHHTFSGDSSDILENINAYSTILNGSGPLHNAYGLPRCHTLCNKTERILNGYRGGVILGNILVDLGLKARVSWLKGRFGLGPRTISPNLEDAISHEEMSTYYGSLLPEAYPRVSDWTVTPEPIIADMIADAISGPLKDTPNEFKLEQWTEEYGGGRHLTLAAILADRHFYADASIFYDYDVRDRCYAIHASDRRNNKAYSEVLNRLLPELASETYANTGVPANYSGLRLWVGKGLYRLNNPKRGSTGVNNKPWLLEPEIRDFFSDLFNSQSFRNRPWWNGKIISGDFQDCLKGANSLYGEFWAAVSLELFARNWLDTKTKRT